MVEGLFDGLEFLLDVLVGGIELERVLKFVSLLGECVDLFIESHDQSLDCFVADRVVLLSDGLQRDLIDHLAN